MPRDFHHVIVFHFVCMNCQVHQVHPISGPRSIGKCARKQRITISVFLMRVIKGGVSKIAGRRLPSPSKNYNKSNNHIGLRQKRVLAAQEHKMVFLAKQSDAWCPSGGWKVNDLDELGNGDWGTNAGSRPGQKPGPGQTASFVCRSPDSVPSAPKSFNLQPPTSTLCRPHCLQRPTERQKEKGCIQECRSRQATAGKPCLGSV